MSVYDKSWPPVHDEFQVLKPVVVEKGKTVVGHASSTVSRFEEEIERLRKRIRELESKKNDLDERIEDYITEKLEEERPRVKKAKSWGDVDSEFFDAIKDERKPNVRSKRSSRSRR